MKHLFIQELTELEGVEERTPDKRVYLQGVMLLNDFDVTNLIYDEYFDRMIIKYQLDESFYMKAESLNDVQMNEL